MLKKSARLLVVVGSVAKSPVNLEGHLASSTYQ